MSGKSAPIEPLQNEVKLEAPFKYLYSCANTNDEKTIIALWPGNGRRPTNMRYDHYLLCVKEKRLLSYGEFHERRTALNNNINAIIRSKNPIMRFFSKLFSKRRAL